VHSDVACARPNTPVFDCVHDSELTMLHVMCVILVILFSLSLFILIMQNDYVYL